MNQPAALISCRPQTDGDAAPMIKWQQFGGGGGGGEGGAEGGGAEEEGSTCIAAVVSNR